MDPLSSEGAGEPSTLNTTGERDATSKLVPPLRSDDLGNVAPASPSSVTSSEVQEDRAAVAAAAVPHRAGVKFSSVPQSKQQPAPSASGAGTVAKRPSRSGRQLIHEASTRTSGAAGDANATGMVTALSVNAQYKTIPEEHAEFRARNRVRSSYRGPVYAVEDVCVPCHTCGGPIDPVVRVPVGSLFFHANCLQCYLCGRKEGVAGLYVQVDRQPVCSECAARKYDRWVPRQEVQSRGMIYGAIQGDVYDAIDAHDRGQRGLPRLSPAPTTSLNAARATSSAAVVGAASLNRSTVPGALPPSLSIRPVHNARNTGRRSFALMERQQYYTQSDNNLLMRPPDAAATGNGGMRRASKAGKAKSAVAAPPQQRITASKQNV